MADARRAGSILALLMGAWAGAAGSTPSSTPTPAGVSYVGGQLQIEATNSTLGELLQKVAAATGVQIEIPSAAYGERLPVVKLGPGPAREVLASLLSDSRFNYLIQSSDTDAQKIQSVLILVRDAKGSGGADTEPAVRSSDGPAAGTGGLEPATAQNMAEATPPAEANQTEAPEPPPPPSRPRVQPMPSGPDRPGAMSPPAVLNQQSINQQLQQMYQQRMQMAQQQAAGTK